MAVRHLHADNSHLWPGLSTWKSADISQVTWLNGATDCSLPNTSPIAASLPSSMVPPPTYLVALGALPDAFISLISPNLGLHNVSADTSFICWNTSSSLHPDCSTASALVSVPLFAVTCLRVESRAGALLPCLNPSRGVTLAHSEAFAKRLTGFYQALPVTPAGLRFLNSPLSPRAFLASLALPLSQRVPPWPPSVKQPSSHAQIVCVLSSPHSGLI